MKHRELADFAARVANEELKMNWLKGGRFELINASGEVEKVISCEEHYELLGVVHSIQKAVGVFNRD